MSDDELVEVYTTNDANEAEIIKSALGAAGIDSEIDGEGQAGLSGILTIGILVRRGDYDRAEKLIQSHGAE